jgi:CBS domain-containing protein
VQSAGELARPDAPTCRLDERLQDVRARLRQGSWDTCVVVNEQRIVLGRLGRRALARDDDVVVEAAMTAGPRTYRPSIGADALLGRLEQGRLSTAVITTSDGRLVGVVLREDLARIRDEGA